MRTVIYDKGDISDQWDYLENGSGIIYKCVTGKNGNQTPFAPYSQKAISLSLR